ncbi:MAG: hypothetical protein ABUK01_00135 [Leptospirales bacterium]
MAGTLLIPGVDRYLDSEMSLHMIAQMWGLALLGVLTGKVDLSFLTTFTFTETFVETLARFKLNRYGVSALVFFIGTITFWMIPRSLDLAVINNSADYIMHINLFCAGLFLGKNLKKMPFVLKTAAGIYGLSMLISVGLTYTMYNSLLCATYDLEMQKETGELVLKIFWFAFVLFIILTAKNLVAFAQQGNRVKKYK